MLVALEGLFDAAASATGAIERIRRTHRSVVIADIDPDPYFNFSELRPEIQIDTDGLRTITWPQNRFFASTVDSGEHDLVLMTGVEPHLRWRSFADDILTVAHELGVEMIVTLGAMAGMAPHTRPLGVVGSATNASLARRLGLGRPSYQGPTGLVGALHDRLEHAGMPVISLRVSVPHYVPGPPNPEATRSLLRRLELVIGVPTAHEALDGPAADWRKRIDNAVANDDELREWVAGLEQQIDNAPDVLPSGDDIATELEAFLRDQRDLPPDT